MRNEEQPGPAVRRAGRTGPARPTVAVVTLVTLLVLAAAGCGGGSGGGDRVERRGSGEERSLTVANRLDTSVGFWPYTGRSGSPGGVEPGETARSGSAPVPGENDVCVALGQGGAIVRLAVIVVGDVMWVSTPARCPGSRPQPGEPRVVWTAEERSGPRLLDAGFAGGQLCAERQGRLDVLVRIEPSATPC